MPEELRIKNHLAPLNWERLSKEERIAAENAINAGLVVTSTCGIASVCRFLREGHPWQQGLLVEVCDLKDYVPGTDYYAVKL